MLGVLSCFAGSGFGITRDAHPDHTSAGVGEMGGVALSLCLSLGVLKGVMAMK
jgi:hypothetical protein